jgi:hypothetical protein
LQLSGYTDDDFFLLLDNVWHIIVLFVKRATVTFEEDMAMYVLNISREEAGR